MRLRDIMAARAGGAFVVLLTLAAACTALRPAPATCLFMYAGACVLCSASLTVAPALAVGSTGWAFLTGFGVNALGQLTFAVPDLVRLVTLLTICLAASLVAGPRPVRARQRTRV